MGTLLVYFYYNIDSRPAEQFLVYSVVNIFKHIEDYTYAGVAAGFYGDLGGPVFREMKVACGDAAEGDAVAVVLLGKPKAGTVATG